MKDSLIYTQKWQFNSAVADCFDDMLSRSVPGYLNMREILELIVISAIKDGNKRILDIGSSIGGSIEHYVKKYPSNKYYCVDSSEDMISVFNKKYRNLIDSGRIISQCVTIEEYVWDGMFDIIQSVLTLQFIAPALRQKIVDLVFEHLNDGGFFLFVEKIRNENAEMERFNVETYHRYKYKMGYSYEQIKSKQQALENILIPFSQDQNIQLLKNAGFKKFDCFWKNLNFMGFIAIK